MTNHEILTSVSLAQAEETIRTNLADLESIIGDKVRFFSYPNGSYNEEVLKLISSTSIVAAFTMVKGLYSEQYNDFEISRIGISGYDDITHFY